MVPVDCGPYVIMIRDTVVVVGSSFVVAHAYYELKE